MPTLQEGGPQIGGERRRRIFSLLMRRGAQNTLSTMPETHRFFRRQERIPVELRSITSLFPDRC